MNRKTPPILANVNNLDNPALGRHAEAEELVPGVVFRDRDLAAVERPAGERDACRRGRCLQVRTMPLVSTLRSEEKLRRLRRCEALPMRVDAVTEETYCS